MKACSVPADDRFPTDSHQRRCDLGRRAIPARDRRSVPTTRGRRYRPVLTSGLGATHNHDVVRSLPRTVLALALAPCLVFSSVAPPEHIHEADADHPHAVIHRHFAPHDHEGTEISHNDGRAIWLDDAALQIATHEFAVSQVIPAANFEFL